MTLQKKEQYITTPFSWLNFLINLLPQGAYYMQNITQAISTYQSHRITYTFKRSICNSAIISTKPLQLPLPVKKLKKPLVTTEFSSINFHVYGSRTIILIRENSGYLVQFFKAYLDMLAKKIVINKRKYPLLDFMNSDIFEDPIIFKNDTWYYWGNNGSGYKQHQSPSLVELSGIIFNCDQSRACAIVAKLTNTSFENLYQFTNEVHSADHSANADHSLTLIPNKVSDYTLSDTKEITGFAGQTIGYICTYQKDNCFLNMMASISKDRLVFGSVSPTAYFINHTEIDKNQEKTILFFQNYNQARAFEEYLNKCTTPPTDIIVTSHISNDINKLPWSLFLNKKVILIPETTKHGFNMLPAYRKKLDGNNAHCRVYPYPLIFKELDYNTSFLESIEKQQLSLLEQILLEKTELVNEWAIPQNLVRKIIQEALPPKEFYKMLKQYTSKTETKDTSQSPKHFCLEQLAFYPQENNESVFTDYSQISTISFFGGGNITLLHARKDSGKSLAALEIAKSLALNTGCFNFVKGAKKSKVLYIEGETSEGTLNQRQEQLQLQKDSPFIISIKSMRKKNTEPWASFNLSSKDCREFLEEFIRKEHIELLILDNITCLVGDRGIASEKMAQEIMYWTTEISSFTSIIIIHHTNEEKDKISGSEIWRRRCTNEIQLLGKKDLRTLHQLPEELRQVAQNCNGAFFGMRFNSSKSCSVLKDKIIWANLPFGASKWNLYAITDESGKTLKDLSVECHKEEISTKNVTAMPPEQTEQSTELSNYDKIYQPVGNYDKIYQAFGNKEFSRSDIDELFHCGKDKSHKILKELEGVIEEIGDGNKKRYRLRKQN